MIDYYWILKVEFCNQRDGLEVPGIKPRTSRMQFNALPLVKNICAKDFSKKLIVVLRISFLVFFLSTNKSPKNELTKI